MIKVTYVACDYEDHFPIVTADSLENIRKACDEYCGADERNQAKFIKFHRYESNHWSDYEGYFEYECKDGVDGTYIDKFNIYCIDFFPKTKI
jgi:hypothetical protein